MMLGLLLARAGVSVLVLEKHADFLRDFRGDTIHPSTLELMHDPDLRARGMMQEIDHPVRGKVIVAPCPGRHCG